MIEIQKVIQMIRDLTNRTTSRGCTEAEALAAASKIGELLKVYNLSMDKVFLGESKCVTLKIVSKGKSQRPIGSCLPSLAEFCDCKVWYNKLRSLPSEYCFFGLETDTEMARYLYALIDNAIDTETTKFQHSPMYVNATVHRKRLTVSFQRGMAVRISNRLNEMTSRRHHEERQEDTVFHSTGTSLIVLKHDKVQEEFDSLFLKLRKTYTSARCTHSAAYFHGQDAADKVNLNRPVTGAVAGLLQ